MVFLPIGMLLAQGQGCLHLVAGKPMAGLFDAAGQPDPAMPSPIVETLVAEPRTVIESSDDGGVGFADSAGRPAFELTMPQGHTLMMHAQGRARWSDEAGGRIGVYLLVQRRTHDDWFTIGSGGVSGSRVGPTSALAQVAVPVCLDEPGTHHLRAIVLSVADPQPERDTPHRASTEDRDVVSVDIVVLPAAGPAPQPVEAPPIPQDDAWLQPDSVPIADMMP